MGILIGEGNRKGLGSGMGLFLSVGYRPKIWSHNSKVRIRVQNRIQDFDDQKLKKDFTADKIYYIL
jgi:hypothetical protein